MLTVDEQGFERFWGPSAIKPLNFNYEFQPKFVGQNIWTLTDNLFVPEHKREQDEGTNHSDFMKVVYNKIGSTRKDARKKSSRYKQFPSIDQNMHQKSSSAQGSYVSRKLKVVGSPLSGSSQQSKKTPSKPTRMVKRVQKSEANPNSTGKVKQHVQSSPKKLVNKKQPETSPKSTLKKRSQQTGLTLKLSQQETEKLLKSLDFKVRTVRKPKPRDRSKSEGLTREKGQISIVSQKRSSASKLESHKTRSIKRSTPKKTKLETQGLLRSSQMSSSSGKNSRSSSGLNELVGPLPKVNWTPTQEPIQQKKSSSASLKKKKSSDKSGASVSKGSKTSTTSKKLKKNPSGSQGLSREPSSEENTSSQQKVKTTRVKMIPKMTLNNQLLKSTTLKVDSKVLEKKTVPKAPPKKKDTKANADSILWTPENIALLDQITNDKQLKAVLMSAGDTYMKTKKYFAVKSNVKAKMPVKQASSTIKKEPNEAKKANAVVAPAKTSSVPAAKKVTKQGNVDIPKSPSKEEKSMASDTLDGSLATLGSKPEATRSSKSPEASVQSIKKGDQKQVTNTQLLKAEGTPKTAKPPKSPARKVANPQSPVKFNKMTNIASKKRPKYGINPRQVRKVEERLAQLSAEVTGNAAKLQDKKVQQVQRSNLDHLRKVIDKSLSKFKEDNTAGEIKSS